MAIFLQLPHELASEMRESMTPLNTLLSQKKNELCRNKEYLVNLLSTRNWCNSLASALWPKNMVKMR